MLASIPNAKRFNRYIVECKFNLNKHRNGYVNDLIDTQWNVNSPKRGVPEVTPKI